MPQHVVSRVHLLADHWEKPIDSLQAVSCYTESPHIRVGRQACSSHCVQDQTVSLLRQLPLQAVETDCRLGTLDRVLNMCANTSSQELAIIEYLSSDYILAQKCLCHWTIVIQLFRSLIILTIRVHA